MTCQNSKLFHDYIFKLQIISFPDNNKSSPDSGFLPGENPTSNGSHPPPPQDKFYENLPFHGMQQQGPQTKQVRTCLFSSRTAVVSLVECPFLVTLDFVRVECGLLYFCFVFPNPLI